MRNARERSSFLFGAPSASPSEGRKIGYLNLPAVSGSYASSPDSTAASITGDIDIRALVSLDDWTPATDSRAIIAKWTTTGNQRSYLFGVTVTTGTLSLSWSADGTVVITKTSTAAPTVVDGERLYVRVTLDVDNGAVGNDVTFYTSTDGISWSQLGDVVTTAGTTSIFDSTATLNIGAMDAGTDDLLLGKIYLAQVFTGLIGGDGNKRVEFDPLMTNVNAGSFTARTGELWTINSTAYLA